MGPGRPPAYFGAGGGTAIVGLSHLFPAGSLWNTVMLYAAPLLSIFLGWAAVVLTYLVSGWTKTFIYNRTKQTLKATLEDPDTSDQVKARTREKLDQLDNARVDSTVVGAIRTLRSPAASQASS